VSPTRLSSRRLSLEFALSFVIIHGYNSRYANDPDVAGIMQTLSQAKANIVPPAAVVEPAPFGSSGGSGSAGGVPIHLETEGLRQRKPAYEETLLVPSTEIVDSDDEHIAASIHRKRQHMVSKAAVEESNNLEHEEFGDGNIITPHSPFWASPAQALASALGGISGKGTNHNSSSSSYEGSYGGGASVHGGVRQVLANVLGLGGNGNSNNADGTENGNDNEEVANLASFPPRSGSAYDMMMQVTLLLFFCTVFLCLVCLSWDL